jgi:hypothetical protein
LYLSLVIISPLSSRPSIVIIINFFSKSLSGPLPLSPRPKSLAMNWMGGNLSRHRRGKGWKEDMAHQEEYFAKARTRQRDHMKSSPVILSAANFIPNHTALSEAAPSEATTSAPRTSSSLPVLFSQPLDAADEASANLGDSLKDMQRDFTERPLPILPSQTNRLAMLNNQRSAEGHFISAPNPEAERRRLLREKTSTEVKLPKYSVPLKEPTQRREYPAVSRHISERQQQLRVSTGLREMPSIVSSQRGNRKRRMSQITASPSPRTLRIRVGSQNYRWSEAGNSIRSPTYSDCSSNGSAEETGCISKNVNNTSYVTNKSFTSFSSSISPLSLSSPGNYRLSRCRKFSDSAQQVERAASAGPQHPNPACTCGPPLKPPSVSEVDSTDSMAVEVGDNEDTPKNGMDEARIWRVWLNQDMFELYEWKKKKRHTK